MKGLSASDKQQLIVPALENIIIFMRRSTSNEHKSNEIIKAAVGLLGKFWTYT